jgi:hypothetical protein
MQCESRWMDKWCTELTRRTVQTEGKIDILISFVRAVAASVHLAAHDYLPMAVLVPGV